MPGLFLLWLTSWGSLATAQQAVRPPRHATAIKPRPAARSIDFARSAHYPEWLQHPVLGGPSFDAFQRQPGNPIWRGKPPLEWPVNAFLFHDPVSTNLYAYIGAYPTGYIGGTASSRCIGMRSADGGLTWDSLGTMLSPDARLFDKNGHTPDVSVVYEAGRYHMVYDWGEADFNREGGLGYAWADKPEGPWHRAAEPLTRNSQLPPLLGRYRRTYAATLIRRRHDWLITGMMDDAPRAWALFVMTSPNPGGPYTDRKLVRCVDDPYFHPPLMEFFPSFIHNDTLYAPATSVALNRNSNTLFCVPLTAATDPLSWRLCQNGSLWHSDDVPSEYDGLWGQTFAGQVDSAGVFRVLFPSRDAQNRGTIGLAHRLWNQPLRSSGFIMSGHAGPSLSVVRRAYRRFRLETRFSLRGIARLLWQYSGLLGPDRATADATIGAAANRSYQAIEFADSTWQILNYSATGLRRVVQSGRTHTGQKRHIVIQRTKMGRIQINLNGQQIWKGTLPTPYGHEPPSSIGWWVEPRSHLTVARFVVSGAPAKSSLIFDATDALLGAGQERTEWLPQTQGFRSAPGYVATRPEATAKWNVPGRQFVLWSPRGPGYGLLSVCVDGKMMGTVALQSHNARPSAPVWTSQRLPSGNHAIQLRASQGPLVLDCLEACQ